MKLKILVATVDTEEEFEEHFVEFEAFPRLENDSFDFAGTHCTNGRSGTCHLPNYISLEYYGNPTWNKALYTSEQNAAIEKQMEKISEEFIEKYIKAI